MTERNSTMESSKSYFGSGKEVRESVGGMPVVFNRLAGGGRVQYTTAKPEGSKEFYLTDHLGSTREVYDLSTGNITYTSQYYPYGKQFSEYKSQAENTTEKFSGKEVEEGTGFTDFGFRRYDGELGTWVSADAARQFHGQYSYSPNPVNTIDPSGNTSLWLAGAGSYKESAPYSMAIINKLSGAGVADVSWLVTHRSGGNFAQGMRAAATFSALNGGPLSFDVSNIVNSYARVGGQFNLIGYSQGAAEVALGALALAQSGQLVDNVVLIAAPMMQSSSVYADLLCSENIGNVTLMPIANDPGSLTSGNPLNIGNHFLYKGNESGQQDKLVKDIVGSGVH